MDERAAHRAAKAWGPGHTVSHPTIEEYQKVLERIQAQYDERRLRQNPKNEEDSL